MLRCCLHYAYSDLSTSQYHAIADATMDSLLDQLEVLVDAQDDSQYEVEYSVRVLDMLACRLTLSCDRVAY